MREALRNNSQFIFILCLLYFIGVWITPFIYFLYPATLALLILRKKYFELLILFIWIVILSDYVPIKGATYNDLQFAKDLKNLNILGMAALYFIDFKKLNFQSFIFKRFSFFFLYCSIPLIYSINLQTGFQKTLSFVLLYLVAPNFVIKIFEERGKRFFLEFFTFISLMLFIGLVLRFAVPDIGMMGDRFKGIFGNPNGTGIFLVLVTILFQIVKSYYPKLFTNRQTIFIYLVFALSVIWSGSRNSLTSILIFFITIYTGRIHALFSILITLTVLLFNDYINFVAIIQVLGLEDYFRAHTIETGSGRAIAWRFAWMKIQECFFFGGGFSHDENIMRPNYGMLSRLGHQGGVHNSYLSMWFDVGLIGLILYFTSLIQLVIKGIKKSQFALPFLFAILFNVNYESWLVGSLNPFTILFLIILSLLVDKDLYKDVTDQRVNEFQNELP